MSTEIIVALIALFGVVISVVISLYTSMKQTKVELQKLRSEIQETYAGKLLEKRIEIYPDMYFLLSDFGKKIQYGLVSKSDVTELLGRIDDWDSKKSLFFSAITNSVSYHFRKTLVQITKMTDEEFQKEFASEETRRDLRHKAGTFELALKSDLGIYVVEFSDISKRFFF